MDVWNCPISLVCCGVLISCFVWSVVLIWRNRKLLRVSRRDEQLQMDHVSAD